MGYDNLLQKYTIRPNFSTVIPFSMWVIIYIVINFQVQFYIGKYITLNLENSSMDVLMIS